MSLPIVEIFNSIEGEGIRSGKLCTFVRTAGCNCRCIYCDTTYSYDESTVERMSCEQIIQKVEQYDCKTITLTGGEPLLHDEVVTTLIPRLLEKQYEINIETNGSIPLWLIKKVKRDKVIFTMDWKSPSSGMNNKMLYDNLTILKEKDVLKFVVGTEEDLQEMKSIIQQNKLKCSIFVSPVFGQIELTQIVQFLKDNKLMDVRLQVQLHKIIWNVSERGV